MTGAVLTRRGHRFADGAESSATVSPPVAFVDTTHEPWGAEESLLTLAEALTQRNVSALLYCRSGSLAARWVERVNSEARIVGRRNRQVALHRLRDCAWLTRILRRIPDDAVVVIFSYHLVAPAVIWRNLSRRRYAIVLDLHDAIGGARGRTLLRFFVSRIEGVVAVSKYSAAFLAGLDTHIEILHRPVSCSVDEHPRSDQWSGRVGIVGRLDPRSAMIWQSRRSHSCSQI